MIGTKTIAEIVQTPGGMLVIRPKPGCSLRFTQAALTKQQCDGSFVLQPLADWISPAEAARLMGISESSVLRLRDFYKDGKPVVLFRRPSPFRLQLQLASVLAHLEQSQENPEFWTTCTTDANPVQERETVRAK
jgi:hypothetical protein